jgi:hypothetical protein
MGKAAIASLARDDDPDTIPLSSEDPCIKPPLPLTIERMAPMPER